MIFPQHILVLGTLLFTALASQTVQPADTVVDWDLFHRLADNVDESSIHSILHKLAPKFKHGVFSKDRRAIEQVHSENPLLATSLLSLARRQSNTTTTNSAAVSSAASEASLSSALAASSALTASTVPAPTTLALAPTTPSGATAVATNTGEVVYSSSGGGLVTVASSIAFVTYQRSSQEVLSTYTLPNGQLTTATSVVVVNAPITASVETGTAGAAQTTGGAGLQSGAACASQGHLKEIVLMLGGAAVVAMAL